MLAKQKYRLLKDILRGYPSILVALSGGVDSALLLGAAIDALGPGNVLAVNFHAAIHGAGELTGVQELAAHLNCRLAVFEDEGLLDNPAFCANPPNRCYICKRIILSQLQTLAGQQGLAAVAEGSNADDAGDYRPGMQAVRELQVLSPLLDAGLTKQEIRQLARELGLPVWNKPSSPCLCSRIPYGSPITVAKLRQIEAGERFLHEAGFPEVRLRHHGSIARIEIPAEQMAELLRPPVLSKVQSCLRNLGFQYVTLDLHGLRSGSLDEILKEARNSGNHAPA
ncbi:Glutamine-dependent NAD(+) synthetase [Sporotomaculum syntrophicum]|uniref:Glutamine-dependent NAD(+) synthetase n=1 Tax=Sporotomaculum syntrophicum TaxID=182264 RepID=A0A9D2WQI2_9FIRM|nr:ATP-dependent sacrificial sulfur transferase LarE [Sporotomaculum syntrophicum]KAF1085071.1 Glutamine-dependent NAD(+) synthetase [Sporotomaculum syntrophicum]